MSRSYLFTSESVSEGHPDKIADQVSDAILDAYIAQDTASRVACETLTKTGLIMVAGEITSNGTIEAEEIIRGVVLSLKETPFVDAARAIGASTPRLLMKHIVPNTFAPLMVLATLDVGSVILAESSLSFLGYGIPPPFPSWGRMLGGDALDFYAEAPWLMLWPGLALTSVIFGSNVFGDALRDILDPRLRGAGRARRAAAGESSRVSRAVK